MKLATLYSLWTHQSAFSQEDLVLNKELFGDYVSVGDYVAIYDPEKAANRLILRVGALQSVNRLEVSISKTVAESMQLKHFSRVCIEKVDAKENFLEYVELTFRLQYIQRGTMWFFKRAMNGRPVHVKETINLGGLKAQIMELTQRGKKRCSGIVSPQTRFIFRSRSARIIWLVQISAEMWEYDHNGDLYFEKFLSKFVEPLIDRWRLLGVSHSLSVVFFSRTLHIDVDPISAPNLYHKSSMKPRPDGVRYQDHFKIVVSNASEVDKVGCMQTLKKEFWSYPALLNWNIPPGMFGGTASARRETLNHLNGTNAGQPNKFCSRRPVAVPSDASNGNVLEAINSALNLLDKHYMDRDLNRTGNCVVVISPGTGAFVVKPDISLITKQRMIDGGVGIDFVSLSQPPLHAVPLFHVECRSKDMDDFYDVPYWMKVSYVDCPSNNDMSTLQGDSVGSASTGSSSSAASTSGNAPSIPTLWACNADNREQHLTATQYGLDFSPHPFPSSLKGYAFVSRLTNGFNSSNSSYVHAVSLPTPLKNIIRLAVPQQVESEANGNPAHGPKETRMMRISSIDAGMDGSMLMYTPLGQQQRKYSYQGLNTLLGLSASNDSGSNQYLPTFYSSAYTSEATGWQPAVTVGSGAMDWEFYDLDMDTDAPHLLLNNPAAVFSGVSADSDAAFSRDNSTNEFPGSLGSLTNSTRDTTSLRREGALGDSSTYRSNGLLPLPRVNRDRAGSSFNESDVHANYTSAFHPSGTVTATMSQAVLCDPDYNYEDYQVEVVKNNANHEVVPLHGQSVDSVGSRFSGAGSIGSSFDANAPPGSKPRRRLRSSDQIKQLIAVQESIEKEDICYHISSDKFSSASSADESMAELMRMMAAHDQSVFASDAPGLETRVRGRTNSQISMDSQAQQPLNAHQGAPASTMATIPEDAVVETADSRRRSCAFGNRNAPGTPVMKGASGGSAQASTPPSQYSMLQPQLTRGHSFSGELRGAKSAHKLSVTTTVVGAGPTVVPSPTFANRNGSDLKSASTDQANGTANANSAHMGSSPSRTSNFPSYPSVPSLNNPVSSTNRVGPGGPTSIIPLNYSPRIKPCGMHPGHSAHPEVGMAKALNAAMIASSPQQSGSFPAPGSHGNNGGLHEKIYGKGAPLASANPVDSTTAVNATRPVSFGTSAFNVTTQAAAAAPVPAFPPMSTTPHSVYSVHTQNSGHTQQTEASGNTATDYSRLVIESYQKVQANPFKQEGVAVKTHNRMRWSQVTYEASDGAKYKGLNLKSLCQPAILPLLTDYFPSPENFVKEYRDNGKHIWLSCLCWWL
jgi:hypothetical protein